MPLQRRSPSVEIGSTKNWQSWLLQCTNLPEFSWTLHNIFLHYIFIANYSTALHRLAGSGKWVHRRCLDYWRARGQGYLMAFASGYFFSFHDQLVSGLQDPGITLGTSLMVQTVAAYFTCAFSNQYLPCTKILQIYSNIDQHMYVYIYIIWII